MGDTKDNRSKARSKKRKPPKPTATVSTTATAELPSSSSAKKLKLCTNNTDLQDNSDLGNSIVNMNLLVSFMRRFGCIECGKETEVTLKSLQGLAQRIVVTCKSPVCDKEFTQDLSNQTPGPSK